MTTVLKKIISKIIQFLYTFSYGRAIIEVITGVLRNNTLKIEYRGIPYEFSAPNSLSHYRVNTFSSKEPETLEWIDNFSPDSVMWDIGANIGLYSTYAAKTKKIRVFSFEPSVFNLELLAKNIFLNGVSDLVTIVALPLSDSAQPNMMRMSSTEWGGALSSFDKNIGWDGNKMSVVFNYKTLGSTIDNMATYHNLGSPDYIKLDVDGIEHFILNGGTHVLSSVKEVLIEINDDFKEQADICESVLKTAGLTLKEKRHSDEFDQQGAFGGGKVWNQIWKREN